jgi:hypothetical protein
LPSKVFLALSLALATFLTTYGVATSISVQDVDLIGAGEAEVRAPNIEVCDVKWYVYPDDISYAYKMDVVFRSTDAYSHDVFLLLVVYDDLGNALYEKGWQCTIDGGFGSTHSFVFYQSPSDPGLPIDRIYKIEITAIEEA